MSRLPACSVGNRTCYALELLCWAWGRGWGLILDSHGDLHGNADQALTATCCTGLFTMLGGLQT